MNKTMKVLFSILIVGICLLSPSCANSGSTPSSQTVKSDQESIKVPTTLEESSIIIDSKIHLYTKGKIAYFSYSSNEISKQKLSYVETDRYERKTYKDQFGNIWRPCDEYSYLPQIGTNKAQLMCHFVPGRQSYYICRSATKNSDGSYEYGDDYGEKMPPAALLTVNNKKGDIYEGKIIGVCGSPTRDTYVPDKLSNFKIIKWK